MHLATPRACTVAGLSQTGPGTTEEHATTLDPDGGSPASRYRPPMAKGALRRHRDFRLLWGGQTVSELGSQISLLAIPLLAVKTLHATTFEMGLLTAASTAAFLIVGLPAGVWVDRVRRRRLMIATDLGRFLALGSIPIAYAVGGLTLVQLFVVTLASGILTV